MMAGWNLGDLIPVVWRDLWHERQRTILFAGVCAGFCIAVVLA